MSTADIARKSCKPCKSGTPPLAQAKIDSLLKQLPGWQQYDRLISKTYKFKNYYQTIAFVNAIAWLSHHQDHHPDLGVTYNQCRVEYSTHVISGLSENDFICAAKVEQLFQS